ncbi:MAG: hypothetical protein KAV00_13175 [Phycisphaerae bacterium]|nr:hypothetical protein [Phycisphaerae bacterium]
MTSKNDTCFTEQHHDTQNISVQPGFRKAVVRELMVRDALVAQVTEGSAGYE